MGGSSSGVGSVAVSSKGPAEEFDGDAGDWQAEYEPDGPQLGAGGWGTVRPVRHRYSGERFALKEPLGNTDEIRARFRREIDVQSKVKHRHVMPIVRYDADYRWFVMPLAERTLEAAGPELGHDDVALVVTHVARGLQAAHSQKYVHRDVKPSNILQVPRGHDEVADWVVADFGVVRRPQSESTNLLTRHAMGTRGYMAPEAALGKHGNVTRLADIYSLGRTVAWLTTGVTPDGLTPLEAKWPWTQLVARMTEYDPDRRLQSMDDVVAAVSDVLKTLRAKRAKSWGMSPTVAPTLGASEQTLLALIFDLAWESHETQGELLVTWDRLQPKWETTATLRTGLWQLEELGYVEQTWFDTDHDKLRAYKPTKLARTWAVKNQRRISEILKPQVAMPVADDDIPF